MKKILVTGGAGFIIHPNNFILNREHRKYEEKYVQLSFKQYVANILRKIGIYKIIAKILGYNT